MELHEQYRIKNKYHKYIYNEFMDVKNIDDEEQAMAAHTKALNDAVIDGGITFPSDFDKKTTEAWQLVVFDSEIKKTIYDLYTETRNAERAYRAQDLRNTTSRTRYPRS